MMSDPSGEKPKIIIDEDWKSRAEAEKSQAEQKAAHEQPAAEAPAAENAQPTAEKRAAEKPESAGHQLPPATLPVLVSTLATQAMVFLGQIPNPVTNKSEVALPEAQHFIDTLAMLQEKTAGNRSLEEDRMFDAILNELRRAYVYVSGLQKQ